MAKCKLCGGRRAWRSGPYATAEILAQSAYRFHLMGQYLDDLPLGAPDQLAYGLPYWEQRLYELSSQFHAAVHGNRLALEEWRSFVRDPSPTGFKGVAAEALRADTEAGRYLLTALSIRPERRSELITRLDANGGTGML